MLPKKRDHGEKRTGKIKSVDVMKDYMKFLSTKRGFTNLVKFIPEYQLDHKLVVEDEKHDKMLERLG